VTLEVTSQPVNTAYEWQSDNGSGGVSWTALPDSNTTNYLLNTGGLSPATYNYRAVISNAFLNVISAPASLTVLAPTSPIIAQKPDSCRRKPICGTKRNVHRCIHGQPAYRKPLAGQL